METLLPQAKKNLESYLAIPQLPQWALKSIEWLLQENAFEALNERFYCQLPFGTAGMRGHTLLPLMTPYELEESSPAAHAAIGSATLNDLEIIRATVGLYCYSQQQNQGLLKLVIAYDSRYFSKHFAELTASTWSQLGGHAALFRGSRSTPQLSFMVRHASAHVGVVITASHNPPHDNGYKVYFKDGGQMAGPNAQAAIAVIRATPLEAVVPYLDKRMAKVETLENDSDAPYLAMLQAGILDPQRLSAYSPRVVYTPLHGTGDWIAAPLFSAVGMAAHCVESQKYPDPQFPTVSSPNPEDPKALTLALAQAQKEAADLVFAFDPDADRMGVAVREKDGSYRCLSGHTTAALLCAFRIQSLQRLGWITRKDRCVVIKSFVTAPLMAAIAHDQGIPCVETLTGFKWIGLKLKYYEELLLEKIAPAAPPTERKAYAQAMQAHSRFYLFGGEESYGYLISDTLRDKDAHSAALAFCELFSWLKEQKKSVTDFETQLYLRYGYFHQRLINLSYDGSTGSKNIQKIIASYRSQPPEKIANERVIEIKDFGENTYLDADNIPIPKEDFFMVYLENGYHFALRASGTEAKIKYYLFGHEPVSSANQLETTRLKAKGRLKGLEEALVRDARMRCEGF